MSEFVTRLLSITRLCRPWLATMLLTLVTFGMSATSPKRVLMVIREDNHVPVNRMIDKALQEKLRTPALSILSPTPSITNPIVSPMKDMAGVRCKPDPGEHPEMLRNAEHLTG
jgi:hypothetical protein